MDRDMSNALLIKKHNHPPLNEQHIKESEF